MADSSPTDLKQPVAPSEIGRLHQLMDLGVPRWTQIIAEFGISDALGETPESAAALAGKTGVNADALHRVMFLLSAHGIFKYAGGRFAHSPLSLLLRSDHPQSQLGMARLSGMMQPQGVLTMGDVLRTGRPFTESLGGTFAVLANDAAAAKIFDEAMTSKANADIKAILEAYDFRDFASIADIGGGRGHLIRAVLQATPRAQGALFDLPHTIEPQKALATARLRFEAGDFFKDKLPECDAYLLMNVIHDWEDEKAIAILKNLRKAALPHARLLLLETLMPEQPIQSHIVSLDLVMLATTGGRERTEAEYRALFAASGFKLDRTITAASGMSILEATPAR